jgi:hypothetical protein
VPSKKAKTYVPVVGGGKCLTAKNVGCMAGSERLGFRDKARDNRAKGERSEKFSSFFL